MAIDRMGLTVWGWFALLGIMCGGCAGPEPVVTHTRSNELLAVLPPGVKDVENAYASVVALTRKGDSRPYCSGVVIHPKLVLTAAHCVCRNSRWEGSSKIRDLNSCSRQAFIQTALYSKANQDASDDFKAYEGEVVAHPGFKIVLKVMDGQEKIVSANADLAVLRLRSEVSKTISPASLHPAEIGREARITVTGFGVDQVNDKGKCLYGDSSLTRRFGTNAVSNTGEAGQVFQIDDQSQALAACGDSGGGSFRDNQLVGILSSVSLGGTSTFTSTYFYREWIAKMISETTVVP